MEAERGWTAVTILPQSNRPVPERGDHVSMQSGTDLAECLLRWEFSRWLPQTGTGQQKVPNRRVKGDNLSTEAPGDRGPLRRFIGATPGSAENPWGTC